MASAVMALLANAQGPRPPGSSASAKATADKQALVFTDVTAAAGIRFEHNSGRAGRKWLPETMGSGVAFFDADADGWDDLFFVNGRHWEPGNRRSVSALYRNNRKGGFTDVTAGSGLDVVTYGIGVAAADYDNDGLTDVYLTSLDGDRLFHNEGGGRFRDVSKAAGIANADFGTSAAWFDYDRDGRLDLFVANYVKWTPATDLRCTLDGATKSYCTPESYPGTASTLYRNLGQGRFEDTSKKAGVADPASKSLGVSTLDFDGDGWIDLFVANDTQPNKLYRNQRNGTFSEVGLRSGVAYSEDGIARGAMGVDSADYDRSGRPHLLVGNFSNQMLGLYHNEGNGLFVDEAPRSTVGRASLLSLTFGLFFFDYDLDGWPDILAANGHIEEEIGRVQPKVQYRQPPLLLRNLGSHPTTQRPRGGGGGAGRFEDASAAVGRDFSRPIVARGAAYGDYDRDGDLDVALSTNHGPAYLFRNDGGNRHNWIAVRTRGVTSNRDGIGAIVRVTSPGGSQWQMVRSGSSYASQSALAAVFGLGNDASASVRVEWPGGGVDEISGAKARQQLVVEEGKHRGGSGGPSPAEH
jgi:hypothetical protein